jgi:hypothetical protein
MRLDADFSLLAKIDAWIVSFQIVIERFIILSEIFLIQFEHVFFVYFGTLKKVFKLYEKEKIF